MAAQDLTAEESVRKCRKVLSLWSGCSTRSSIKQRAVKLMF